MVTTRKRALAAEVPASPKRRGRGPPRRSSSPPPSPLPLVASDGATPEGYEKFRDERIRENLERMQKLGILDLSLQLTSRIASASPSPNSVSRRANHKRATPIKDKPRLPPRRSSRLQNVAPVSYAEICVKKDEDSERKGSLLIEEGRKEEVYTDEHEKLLGTCETSWDLFVDGYDKDGKRIYDQIKGKTCHQCRQKTLGHRTHCIKCKLVQGQFCGDCLYMRYGENVLEANKNPNWICPVCRGICNCSLCRIKKGWVPTGTLYKKISQLGYKSVAHYLIQTRRSPGNLGEPNSTQQISSKKSLPFTDEEATSNPQNPPASEDDIKFESHEKNSAIRIEKSGSTNSSTHTVSSDAEDDSHPGKSRNGIKLESDEENIDDCDEKSEVNSIDTLTVGHAEEGSDAKPGSESKKAKKPAATVIRSPECIAGRLRSQVKKP